MSILGKLFGGKARKPDVHVTNATCDVCSTKLDWKRGYGLTTTQVTTRESYWEFLFTHQGAGLRQQDPRGDNLAATALKMADQRDTWLVCESCSSLFVFDRDIARQFAIEGRLPPGLGPASANLVALAAAYAWSKVFDSWPSSIKVREAAPPTDTQPCDFCRRYVYPDEQICLINEGALEVYEGKGGLKRRGDHSVNINGKSFWLACSLCAERSYKLTGLPVKDLRNDA